MNLRKRKKGCETWYMFKKNKLLEQVKSKGMTLKEVAHRLGIDYSTLYRKMNNDGNFTRTEINNLIMILEISDPGDIFFSD